MPQAGPSIFNERATEKLRSPDDLDRILRVTNPSVWAVLAACIALLVGLLAWGIFGSASTSVSGKGVCKDGVAVCFISLEDRSMVRVGNEALVESTHLKVASVSEVPLSQDEAKEVLDSDFMAYGLMPEDWAYLVAFEGDTSSITPNVPVSVSITTDRVAPISLLLGGE